MNNRFFEPFRGSQYEEGIRGKKVLVLGASFYCPIKECIFFNECTNPEKKDSSKFDSICPYNNGSDLHNQPSDADGRTYHIFGKFMSQFADNEDKNSIWERLSFTNYLQFFSPTIITYEKYLSNRDFLAFLETLREFKPDIVISWGTAILKSIRENNPYIIDKEDLPCSDYYLCHIKLPDDNHTITLVSAYHPSSMRYWKNDLDLLKKYTEIALNERTTHR